MLFREVISESLSEKKNKTAKPKKRGFPKDKITE